ncbi:MAG: hypothetical protein Q8R26_01850 [bacterium]|nr:hypothetical protein [bacterium]
MNLKKVAQAALLIVPLIALSGCDEWKADEKLVSNIWQEVVKITELNPDTPMSRIVFLQTSPPGAHGRFYLQNKKAEIYLGSIYRTIWRQRDAYDKYGFVYGKNISYKEGEALVYNTVAHEMLHYALYLKGVPSNDHHRQMKEKGYLLSVIGYINDYFKINAGFKSHRNGWQEDISMQSLDI